jgi:phosphatidylglycerol:prolipoprotein diacylglycerol transferase
MISHIVWDIDPIIIHEVEFLRWYGVCWVIGTVAGHIVVFNIYKLEGIPSAELDKLTLNVMLGAIVGARLGHVLFYDPIYYLNNPIEILPIRIKPAFQFTGLAGLASHGGILGALFALYYYRRKSKRNYLWLLDRLMIGGAALGGFIRLGNLMNSEIIGSPTQLPWAFIFTSVDNVPRHPSQLYEAICYFALSISLYVIWRSGKFHQHTGFIFGVGLTSIFVQRFLIEFLKEDQVPFEENLALNMGQTLSIPLVLVGIFIMIWRLKVFQPKDKLDENPSDHP